MEFHAYHGVYEEEGKLGARFVVDVELGLRIGGRDILKSTVDYGRVYDIVRRAVTEEKRYRSGRTSRRTRRGRDRLRRPLARARRR